MPNVAAKLRTFASGEMRHVCNLEQLIAGDLDAVGTPQSRYVVVATNVRFTIDDWKPYEAFNAAIIEKQLSTRIRIRYRPGMEGIAPGQMRLAHTTNPGYSPPVVDYYDIVGAVRDTTLRVDLTLTCIRRDADGFRQGVTP